MNPFKNSKNAGEVDLKIVFFIVAILIIGLLSGKIMGKYPVFLIGGVLGIVAVILCFVNFKAALFMLIFSMLLSPEFGERTTEGGGATIRLDDLLLVIIAFGWLARSAVYKGTSLFKSTPMNKLIFFYICSCVFSTMGGMMAGRVGYVSGSLFVFKYIEYFVVYFMAVNYITKRDDIRQFIIAMFITLIIVCFVAIAQIPAGGRVTAPFEGEGGEPNTLGGYVVLMMSIVIGILFNLRANFPKIYKNGLITLVGLGVIVVLFTRSRGSWVAIMPMFLMFVIISKKRFVLIIFLIIFAALFPIIAPKEIKRRVLYTFEKQSGQAARIQEKVGGVTLDTSTSERVSSWKDGLEAFTKHPVLGWGITGWRFLDAQYVKTLVEQGFLGFATFAAMIFALCRETRRIYLTTNDKLLKGIAMGFFPGIFAMLAHGLSTNTFIIVRIMEPFWFLAALVMSIPAVEQHEAALIKTEDENKDKDKDDEKEEEKHGEDEDEPKPPAPEVKKLPEKKRKLLTNAEIIRQLKYKKK